MKFKKYILVGLTFVMASSPLIAGDFWQTMNNMWSKVSWSDVDDITDATASCVTGSAALNLVRRIFSFNKSKRAGFLGGMARIIPAGILAYSSSRLGNRSFSNLYGKIIEPTYSKNQ